MLDTYQPVIDAVKKNGILIITPHMSWGAKGSRQRIMDTTVENVKAWLRGAPQNVVNQ